MYVSKLKLTNFRNFPKLQLDFDQRNVIVGTNGAGKSSVIEAINFLALGKSIRTSEDKEAINFGKEVCHIEGYVEQSSDKNKLEVTMVQSPTLKSKKQVKVNSIPRTLTTFAGHLSCVTFTPLDLDLITTGPQARRKFLDHILMQVSRDYRKSLSQLIVVVRNRNKVLELIRDEGRGRDQLGFWNDQLMQTSSVIHNLRQELFSFLEEPLINYGQTLNSNESILSLSYIPSLVTLEKLLEYEPREIASKSTLIGPNRDDFRIFLDKMDVYNFGSRGYQRTCILGLKLAELDFVAKKTAARPLLLLDDILSELDENHREQLLSVSKLGQTIVTTTDISSIQKYFPEFNVLTLN